MCKWFIHLRFPNLITMFVIITLIIPGVFGEEHLSKPHPGTILFTLSDIGEPSTINRVALMKTGDYTKDGRVHQYENISYNKKSNEILWTPCNNNDCSYASFPTSGGNNGPSELILELNLLNPVVDVSSCYGNPTCERLLGGTSVKSGMLSGVYKTGKAYDISISSLKPGIGQQFTVIEKI